MGTSSGIVYLTDCPILLVKCSCPTEGEACSKPVASLAESDATGKHADLQQVNSLSTPADTQMET